MRFNHFTFLSALWLAAIAGCGRNAHETADIVLRNARVFASDGRNSVETAVATRGDRIVYVGNEQGVEAWIGKNTRVIDATGCTVTPGLVDAHGHLHSLGRILLDVNLIGTRSIDDVVARVREYEASSSGNDWIHGRGWDQNDWATKDFPTWRDLEATNQQPVYLDRVDGHAMWVNRRALEIAGITRDTPDPPGGKIIRDAQGDPTGVFVDNAEALIEDHIPEPSAKLLDRRLAAAVKECNRVGLTGVHDAGTTRPVLDALRRLGESGALSLNVYCMIDSDDRALCRERFAAGPAQEFDGRLTMRCVKLRADGALGSRGAALLSPYEDDPGNVGLNVQPAESLLAWTEAALRAGFQVATHAIGDRGNRIVLDAYERAGGEKGIRNARLRIEHCQILDLADLPRFASLGVIASMQPTHATSDMPWAETRVGANRLAGAYAWRALLANGAVLAFGSDFPVESVDPVTGIYAAVTRQDADGNPPGGWRTEEKIGIEEAIVAFTGGAAHAAFDENDAGRIEPGLRADLTVLDHDVWYGDPRILLETHAKYTIVRGRVVYERP